MGRRAKKAAVVTKKRVKLSKRFKCPFCANEDVVECKMDMKAGIGSLACRLCGASYQMPIHHLHEPIDVFSEWLDDCEAAAATHHHHPSQQQTHRSSQSGGAVVHGDSGGLGSLYDDEVDDDDDDLPESSGVGSRKPPPAASSSSGKVGHKNSNHAASIALGSDDSDDD